MALPDMTNLIVHLSIPEAELSTIREGQPALITPAAYPDLQLRGHIEFVGTMAQTEDFVKEGTQVFRIVVALEDTRPELRTGMSVSCRVLTFESEAGLADPAALCLLGKRFPVLQGHQPRARGETRAETRPVRRPALRRAAGAGDKVMAP